MTRWLKTKNYRRKVDEKIKNLRKYGDNPQINNQTIEKTQVQKTG